MLHNLFTNYNKEDGWFFYQNLTRSETEPSDTNKGNYKTIFHLMFKISIFYIGFYVYSFTPLSK